MKADRNTLLALGGVLSGALALSCSDGERLTDGRKPDGNAQSGSDSAPPANQGPVDDVPATHGQHLHAADLVGLELNGSELRALPSSLRNGDRFFDTVVQIKADGTTARKIVETTAEQREYTSNLTRDLNRLYTETAGKPSHQQLATWRTSWGLPSIEESTRQLDELMSAPFDVMLVGEIDSTLEAELKGLEGELQVLGGSQTLAASGFSYIYAANGGFYGGACAAYIGGNNTATFWTGTGWSGNTLCMINLWNDYNGSSHTKYQHITHTAYWAWGTDVDSFVVNNFWNGSRTSTGDTGLGAAGYVESSVSGNMFDGKVGCCIDPVAVQPACW